MEDSPGLCLEVNQALPIQLVDTSILTVNGTLLEQKIINCVLVDCNSRYMIFKCNCLLILCSRSREKLDSSDNISHFQRTKHSLCFCLEGWKSSSLPSSANTRTIYRSSLKQS